MKCNNRPFLSLSNPLNRQTRDTQQAVNRYGWYWLRINVFDGENDFKYLDHYRK